MIISNSSPLIYLSKLRKENLLKKLLKEIIIPKEVYEEVVYRKEEKYLDALRIKNAVNEGWIKVKKIKIDKEIIEFAKEIDIGEAAVISLARKLKPSLILIDDASARAIAESFGFNVQGTLYVLLLAYKKKILNNKEIKELLSELISAGFRISTELYSKILNEIDKNKPS